MAATGSSWCGGEIDDISPDPIMLDSDGGLLAGRYRDGRADFGSRCETSDSDAYACEMGVMQTRPENRFLVCRAARSIRD